MTEIVGITLEEDLTQKRRLVSNAKTFSVDTVNNPVQLIVPFNPSRYKTFIVSNDTTCVVTADNPPGATPITTVGATPPPGASIVVGTTGNGFDGYEIYGPDPLWAIAIVGNTITRLDVIQTIWDND